MENPIRPTKKVLEELQKSWQITVSGSYVLGNSAIACHLCQACGTADPSAVYALILQKEAVVYGMLHPLTLTQAEELYTLFVQNEISLCHVEEILEDMAFEHARRHWMTF